MSQRSIRTVKEGARKITQGLLFKWYPGILIKGIVTKANGGLNNFLPESGVSKSMSPKTIITGLGKVDYNNCNLELGQCCEAHTHPNLTNKQHTRLVESIALFPSNNYRGYYFMSLLTRKRLHNNRWRQLSMTRDVIRQVEQLVDLFLNMHGAANY